jgi:hypothetical protein
MEKRSFGLLSSGEAVSLYTLESGDFKATWTDYGLPGWVLRCPIEKA